MLALSVTSVLTQLNCGQIVRLEDHGAAFVQQASMAKVYKADAVSGNGLLTTGRSPTCAGWRSTVLSTESSPGTASFIYRRMTSEPLYHASLDSAEYRILLHDNGFDVATHVVEDPACGIRTVWLAQLNNDGR